MKSIDVAAVRRHRGVLRKNFKEPFYDRSPAMARAFAAAVCLAAAFICVTMVSKSSFLYVFHDGNDVNWFLTVGRGIVNGLVPYRDLFEQKGVLLYMLFALNYAICGNQLYVIYVIQVLCGAAFLYAGFCIIRLWAEYRAALFGTLLLALVYFCCRAYWCGAGEAEEYCMPLVAYGAYVMLKSAKGGTPVTCAQAAVCGMFSSCIFWIKYSLLAFYFALAVCVFAECAASKRLKEGFACAAAFVGAFAAASLPWLVYFGVNGALGDMWRVYIYINIFGYAGGDSAAQKLHDIGGALLEVPQNFILYIFVVFGAAYVAAERRITRRAKIYYFAVLLFTFAVQCVVMGSIGYYHLAMAAFVPPGIAGAKFCVCGICAAVRSLFKGGSKGLGLRQRFAAFYPAAKERGERAAARIYSAAGGAWARLIAPAMCLLAACCLVFGNNTLDMFKTRAYYPQFTAARLVRELGGEDADVLNYKMYDRGFYTVLDEVPEYYYFALNLISRESYPELYEGQEGYVRQCLPDFVVTEEEVWRQERGEGMPLSGYKYVAPLHYDYIRNNIGKVRLEMCLLARRAAGGAVT